MQTPQNVSSSIAPIFDAMPISQPNFQCTIQRVLKLTILAIWQPNQNGPSILYVINREFNGEGVDEAQTFKKTRFTPKQPMSLKANVEPRKGRWSTQDHSKASKDPKSKKGTQYEPYSKVNHKGPTSIAKERMKSVKAKKPLLVPKVQKLGLVWKTWLDSFNLQFAFLIAKIRVNSPSNFMAIEFLISIKTS